MSGKFNFSNLRRLKEVKVKRPARPFSALTSLIPMHVLPLQTIHSLPTRTNTLPAFILPSDHTRISTRLLQPPPSDTGTPSLNPLLKERCVSTLVHQVWGFFLRVYWCPQSQTPDKAVLSVRELHTQECGLDIYGQRDIHVPAPLAS